MAKKLSKIDQIADKAVRFASRIAREALRRIMSLFGSRPLETIQTPNFRDQVVQTLQESGEKTARALYDSGLAGILQGGAGVVGGFSKAPGPIAPLPPAFIKPPPISDFLYGKVERPFIDFPIIREVGDILQGLEVMSPQDFYEVGRDLRQRAFTVSGNLTTRSIEHVRQILEKNFDVSQSRTKFLEEVEAGFETMPLGEAHLEQVFRNTINSAFSDGAEKVLENPLVTSAFPFRAYYPIRDSRARPEHRALEFLGLSGTNVYWGEDPVWEMFRPPWDWNLIGVDSIMQGRVQHALKADYSGDVYKLRTESGRTLTIAPNHPVLTPSGFATPGNLHKGGYLVSYNFPFELGIPGDNINHRPAYIADIFDFFGGLSRSVSVKTSGLDLHGDSIFTNGKINVVSANSELRGCLNSAILESVEQFSFTVSDLNAFFLSCRGTSVQNFFACSGSSPGFPHGGEPCGGAISLESEFASFGSAAKLDVGRYKSTANGVTTDPKFFAKLQNRFPREIFTDKILDIHVEHYCGPMYDLQTATGYMVANGIVVSNCRCGWNPLTIRQAARKGVEVAIRWLKTGKPPTRKQLTVKAPPFLPSPSWQRIAA